MIPLEERIKFLQSQTGWDISTIARAAGVTPSAVSQWMGKGAKPTQKIGDIRAAQALEAKTGLSALWLARGEGPQFSSKAVTADAAAPLEAPKTVTQTIFELGQVIDRADERTRRSVARLLSEYAEDPSQSASIAEAIAALLKPFADGPAA